MSTLGVRAASIGGLFSALGVGYVLSSYVGRRAASSQRLRATVIALLGLIVLASLTAASIGRPATLNIAISAIASGGLVATLLPARVSIDGAATSPLARARSLSLPMQVNLNSGDNLMPSAVPVKGGGECAAASDQGGVGDEDRQISAVNQARRTDSGADALVLLRRALDHALKTRDPIAVSALRSALSAISNAEAVSAAPAVARANSPHIAGAAAGAFGGEARRRDLSAADVDQIVQAEISERLQAADDYDRSGRAARAERLRAEASVLASALSSDSSQREG